MLMDTTKIIVTTSKKEKYGGDLLIYCVVQSIKGPPKGIGGIWPALQKGFELGDFSGKCGEKLLLYPEMVAKASHYMTKRLAIIGMGNVAQKNTNSTLREKLRLVGGHIAHLAKDVKASKIMICLPRINNMERSEEAECLVEGVLLGDYRFLKYKSPNEKEPAYQGIKEIKIHTDSSPANVRKGVRKSKSAAYAARCARDMANEPGNGWTPLQFAKYASDLAETYPMICKILEKRDMKRLKMGGILAVNQGSSTPPKMVILEYIAKKKAPTLLLVGKGLTFDSGGVSLKPAAGMQDMKYDMCGGAAVLSLMQAVGSEKPDVNVVAIVPATDNMSGSSALKPGDIIRHYNSVTSEIINTDGKCQIKSLTDFQIVTTP